MNEVPRTFCITLRETPKRKNEARQYFEKLGMKVEMFDGIHGQSFGLKTTIPNYEALPGREYFITPGHVGCILSHLMLWNVLISQPEEEFLILEDDVQFCDGFSEKFDALRDELPENWEMVYVGWLPNSAADILHVSENVVTTNPFCTHAYMVKKSALKVLIETNQLAWNHIDLQINSRSLPRLVHYASKVSLITQRSVLNIKEETWYSLCYDWGLNPSWLNALKVNSIRMGTGWHPLEKNADGYMIWSDGRGEFVFDESWDKMELDFIAEGEVEKKLRVICPSQSDQVFDIKYGLQRISFPINGAKSVIIVSDTFRPIDIYKTSDCRRLGVRILKGITLTDSHGKSTFVSLYSMYGAKKTEEVNKVGGIKVVKIKYSHGDGKINLRNQMACAHHRSGWDYVLRLLSDYHRDDATLLDGWLENSFSWRKEQNAQLRLIPFREPWVGIFHNPPNTPGWVTSNGTPFAMIQSKEFQDSLGTCQGIYVLSKYHADFLRCFFKTVPVEVLYHPTETPGVKFNFDEFVKNDNKKVFNVGWWCRKLSSIYQLDVDRNVYQKIRLLPDSQWVQSHVVEQILDIESSFRKTPLDENMIKSVVDIRYMPNDEYDEVLSKNIVFLDMYDASANNAVVECMVRGTPILVNPLPAVKEYLGEDYPFYFTTLAEAAKKLRNMALIKATHEYLISSGIVEKVSGDFFLKTIREGEIWKSLP